MHWLLILYTIVGPWKMDAGCDLLCTLNTLVTVGVGTQRTFSLRQVLQIPQSWRLLYHVAVGIGGRRACWSRSLVYGSMSSIEQGFRWCGQLKGEEMSCRQGSW
jgi:hypothetical protein